MIRVFTFLVVFFVSVVSQKLQAQQTISVTVENVPSNKGKVGFALFTKESFLRVPLQRAFAKIENGKSTITFKDVPSGVYAVSCFHDNNDNDKMDFSPQGMPMEDFGMSNNNINPYGPPLFEDSKFVVEDKNVSLKIRF